MLKSKVQTKEFENLPCNLLDLVKEMRKVFYHDIRSVSEDLSTIFHTIFCGTFKIICEHFKTFWVSLADFHR